MALAREKLNPPMSENEEDQSDFEKVYYDYYDYITNVTGYFETAGVDIEEELWEDFLDEFYPFIGFFCSARHHAWTMPCAFLTTGNAHSHKMDSIFL